MEIPKLTNGGIIDNKFSFILVDGSEESEHIPLLPSTKKSIQIYHRTKNRRIKKKLQPRK